MKLLRSLTVALALSTPATLFAQGAQEQPTEGAGQERQQQQEEQMPVSQIGSENQQQEPRQQQEPQQQQQQQGQAMQQTDKQSVMIKTHVLPTVAGIQAADSAAAALYELAGTPKLERRDAQRTVQLAQQGLQVAMNRAQALEGIQGLSQEEKAEANTAVSKLKEARSTLQQLQKKTGARIDQKAMEQIREQARDLHTDLSDAEQAVERIAKAHDISTDLEFGG